MRQRRYLVLASVLSLLLASCANAPAGGSASPSTAASSDESEAPEASSEPTGTALERAENGEFDGTTVEVLAQWVEAEADNFEANFADFEARTGIDVAYEGITDYETVLNVRVDGGDAPDLAQLAQPGLMRSFQADGKLIPLSSFMDVETALADYIPSFIDLASVDGDLYGLYYKTDLKSIVGYPVQAFADAGYEIPETWDDLIALSDQIVADGSTPWCISIEHGDASGWVATDWIEDILLRTAGTDVYDQWVSHEIPFDAPEVLAAADKMAEIWFTDGYVYGGNTAINATFVGDTQTPMFDEAGPQCWMHKQAAWIPGFWPADDSTDPPTPLFEPGVDSSFFYLPPIDEEFGRPVLGGGDMFVMFNDRPEVQAVLEFLATPEAAEAWIQAGGFVSPNNAVPAEWYDTYPSSGLAEILADATSLSFDASDTMPADVGSGTFWAGMIDWVAANGEGTEQIFADIEASWPAD